jgi:hypothetical protein
MLASDIFGYYRGFQFKFGCVFDSSMYFEILQDSLQNFGVTRVHVIELLLVLRNFPHQARNLDLHWCVLLDI